MKGQAVHENLDTSFVNLPALVKYLRRREFVGKIRVELSGYEADIVLTNEKKIHVRELDRFTGRSGEGDEALKRLLIRSRDPGGVIHVFRFVENGNGAKKEQTPVTQPERVIKTETVAPIAEIKPRVPTIRLTKHEPVAAIPAQQMKMPEPVKAVAAAASLNGINGSWMENTSQPRAVAVSPNLAANMPFELKNNFEIRTNSLSMSTNDWNTLVKLLSEVLRSVDECVSRANLDFEGAFKKASTEVSVDYPFMDPNTNVVAYSDGILDVNRRIAPKLLTLGIISVLRRIIHKLSVNPKLANIYQMSQQRLRTLNGERSEYYKKFGLSGALERLASF